MVKFLGLLAFVLAFLPCAALAAEDGTVLVKGGSFTMGSPNDEPWRSADEAAYAVELSDFYIAAREVTQAEWEAVMNGNPSASKGPNLPVENVTWLDAVAFCNAKSAADGLAPAYEIADDAVT